MGIPLNFRIMAYYNKNIAIETALDIKAEILINATPQETRVALIENGLLQEIHIERAQKKGLAGNIYKGVIERVLPGMQAAFVDIGLERAAFLHVSDVLPIQEELVEPIDLNSAYAEIHNWLKEGQELLVQVIKDPIGSKGARLTTHLSIASRYLVYMPDLPQVGVSLRLDDSAERNRLKTILNELLPQDALRGYIIRTAAEGVAQEVLLQDQKFLEKLWELITKKSKKTKARQMVYEELPLAKRAVRDMVNASVEKVRVDQPQLFEELLTFSQQFVPENASKLELISYKMPIFDRYGIEEELQKNLKRHVDLKSGGYLVIDQTEAMTTIDVNTGSFTGSLNLGETVFKTNLEAAQAVARQLRLRNLGGIIVVDFIDMTEKEHKEQVLSALQRALAADSAKIRMSDFTEFGLVQITRKRIHESLLRELCELCPECAGRGMVKTAETLAYDLCRDIEREVNAFGMRTGFLIVAAPSVVNWLMEEAPNLLAELEVSLSVPIKLKAEQNYTREQYDIVPL